MNWLSHIFLSKSSIQYQLGNLLADPLKGKPWDTACELTRQGFVMHKKIDLFTDSNENVLRSKSRLSKKKYLKGVVIDIVYDYLLVKNWQTYSSIELKIFLNQFYQSAAVEIDNYPEIPNTFVNRLISNKILSDYSTLDGLETTFKRVDERLSKKLKAKECTVEYIPIIKKEIKAINQDFSFFFPQLISFFKENVNDELHNHWLIK